MNDSANARKLAMSAILKVSRIAVKQVACSALSSLWHQQEDGKIEDLFDVSNNVEAQ